jgi:hypothetical protein
VTELPRRFHLQRDTDITGVSGTGRVADGILWPDGSVALRWRGNRPSTVHWDRIADAEHVHGHHGATRIVWDDQQPGPLAEVWVVWREDEAAYGYFTTEQAGKQATIDCWEEDEPVCPDYSWRPDGPRWELLVGDERAGVYASRHKVYGQPTATGA